MAPNTISSEIEQTMTIAELRNALPNGRPVVGNRTAL